jgi:hypothetical protein
MKKTIFIIGLILIGLFLLGCTENQSNLPSEINTCQTQGQSIISADPRVLEDPSLEETLYTNYVDKCILNKVLSSNDMELCNYLEKQENKSLCECEKLEGTNKDNCYSNVATNHNVGLHCYSINDETIKQTCLTNFE